MTNDKAYEAQVKQHGQMYYYYGATYDEALSNARARTLAPNWDTIYVFCVKQEEKK